jgi:hypothetical protein
MPGGNGRAWIKPAAPSTGRKLSFSETAAPESESPLSPSPSEPCSHRFAAWWNHHPLLSASSYLFTLTYLCFFSWSPKIDSLSTHACIVLILLNYLYQHKYVHISNENKHQGRVVHTNHIYQSTMSSITRLFCMHVCMRFTSTCCVTQCTYVSSFLFWTLIHPVHLTLLVG